MVRVPAFSLVIFPSLDSVNNSSVAAVPLRSAPPQTSAPTLSGACLYLVKLTVLPAAPRLLQNLPGDLHIFELVLNPLKRSHPPAPHQFGTPLLQWGGVQRISLLYLRKNRTRCLRLRTGEHRLRHLLFRPLNPCQLSPSRLGMIQPLHFRVQQRCSLYRRRAPRLLRNHRQDLFRL